ncbi:hypothetical protein RB195_020247 [Necator americanus]|uniref:UPAR/Ly6 domain-containing protein n=1 Tax=Necator americanus TaxID=51031 RepID=A0ABR1CHY5_NECAM
MLIAVPVPLFGKLEDLARTNSLTGTACYSCVALNYRISVPSRNAPLPPSQDAKNLSELFKAMQESGVRVPTLADTCADLSPSSSPSSFMQSPIVLCRPKRCTKLTFNFKGERVVVRNCISNTFSNESLLQTLNSQCLEKYSNITIGTLNNVSICECERDLCNLSAVRLILIVLIAPYLTM